MGMSMPKAARRDRLSAGEVSYLASMVAASSIAAVARELGLSRHAVAVLLAPDARPSAGLVALARQAIEAHCAANSSPPNRAA